MVRRRTNAGSRFVLFDVPSEQVPRIVEARPRLAAQQHPYPLDRDSVVFLWERREVLADVLDGLRQTPLAELAPG